MKYSTGFIVALVCTSLSLPAKGSPVWKSATELLHTLSLREIQQQLPTPLERSWLQRMEHRAHHHGHFPGEEVEAQETDETGEFEASNFGGYINLLTQNVEVIFSPESGELNEWITVELEVNEDDLDKIPLSFPDHFNVSSLTEVSGRQFTWFNSTNTLILELEEPAQAGERFTFLLEATGTVECPNTGIKPCDFGGNYAYITHADFYIQGSPVVLDMFKGSLTVTVPGQQVVVATGRLVETTYTDDTSTFTYIHDFETIFYSFAVSNYVTTEAEIVGVPVRVHTRPNDEVHHEELLITAKSILEFYETEFSLYPFMNLDMVQMDNNFGGGYGPQATVFMYRGAFDTDGGGWGGGEASRTQLISHEIAHQWWGNFVNLQSAGAVILSEGLAEYSSALHWEKMYESRSNFISNGLNYLYTVPDDEDVAIGSAYVGASPYYNTLAYDKASVVFDMLKYELGEEVFQSGMEAYISQHGYSAATLADYFEIMEEVSGKDLTVFQEQWINGTGHPTFEIETLQTKVDDKTWKLEITLEQGDEKPFQLKMPLRVTRGDTGDEVLFDDILIDGETTTAEKIVDFPIRRVHFDRTRIYLSRNMGKNDGDPNLSGIQDGSDLIDLAAMQHRNIVFSYGNQDYFFPNGNYNPTYDLDSNGRIDSDDIELFLSAGELEDSPINSEETAEEER